MILSLGDLVLLIVWSYTQVRRLINFKTLGAYPYHSKFLIIPIVPTGHQAYPL